MCGGEKRRSANCAAPPVLVVEGDLVVEVVVHGDAGVGHAVEVVHPLVELLLPCPDSRESRRRDMGRRGEQTGP